MTTEPSPTSSSPSPAARTTPTAHSAPPAPGLGHIAGGTFSLDPNLNWHAESSAFVTRCIPFTRLFRDPAVEREYIRCRSSQGKTAASALLIGVSSTVVISLLMYPPPDAESDVILSIILAICAYMFGAGVVEYLICGRRIPATVAEDHVLATRHRWAQRLAWLIPTQILVTALRFRSNPVCGPVAPRFAELQYQCLRSFRSVYSVCGLFTAIMVRDPDWATGGLVLQTLSEFAVLFRNDITAVDFAFRFVLAAPFAWMMAFQNAVRDRSDRIAFGKHIMLHLGRTELLAQRTMLEAVVEAAIPPVLLKRLMTLQPDPTAGTLPLHELGDASPRALVVATSAVGFGVFATSKLLDRTVSSLHSLFSFFDAALEAFGLEHGAVHGDTFVATAGLLHRNSRHRRPADLANAVLCFAWWQINSRLPVDCELHSAVCAGPLTGSVCGSHRLRYIAAGPALEEALRGLSSAPAGEVWAHRDVFCDWSNEEVAASPFAMSTAPSTVANNAAATSWRRMETDRVPMDALAARAAFADSSSSSPVSDDSDDALATVPPIATLRSGIAAATEDDDAEELPLIPSPAATSSHRGRAERSAAGLGRSPDGGDTDRPTATPTMVQFGLGLSDPSDEAAAAAASPRRASPAGHAHSHNGHIEFPSLVPDPDNSKSITHGGDGGEAAASGHPAHAHAHAAAETAAVEAGPLMLLPNIHRPEHAVAALVGSLKLATVHRTSPMHAPLVSRVTSPTAGNGSITSASADEAAIDPIAAADAMARASHVAPTDGRDLRTISRVDFWSGVFADPDDEIAYQRYRERRLDTLLGTLIASQAIVWITLGLVAAVERVTSPEVSYSDAGWHDATAFGLLLIAFATDCFIAIRHLRIVKYNSGRDLGSSASFRDPATRSRDVRINQGVLVTTSIIGTLGLLALRRSVVTNHIEYLQMLMFGLNASSLATLRWWMHLAVCMALAIFYLVPVQYHQAYIPWPVVLLQLLLVAWGSPTAAFTDRIRAGIGLTLDMQTQVVRANSRLLAAFADRLVPASNVDAALAALREATDQRTRMGWKGAGIEDRFRFLLRRPLSVGFKESIADFVCMEVRLRQPAAAATTAATAEGTGVSEAVASWADSATAMTRSPRSQQQQQHRRQQQQDRTNAAPSSEPTPGTGGWESAKQLATKWGQLESVIESASGQHLHLLSTLGDTFTVGGPFIRSDAAERCAAEACVRLLTSLLALLPSAGFTAAGVIEEAMAALVGEARLRYRVYGVAPLHCAALAEEGAAMQQRLHQTPVRMAFVSRRFAGQAGALVGQLSRPHFVPAAPAAPGSSAPQQQYMAPPCLIPLAPQRWRVRTTGVTTVFPLLFAQPTPPM